MTDNIYFAFLALHFVVLLWLLTGYFRLPRRRSGQLSAIPRFSVLIAARNEGKNLPALLESLQKQTISWSEGEAVIVLDRCSDNSVEVVSAFAEEHPWVIPVVNDREPGELSPKKSALLKGYEEITGEVVLQTDADAILPPEWIETHLKIHMTESPAVVSGLFNFKLPSTLWGYWVGAEKRWTFMIAAASAGWGNPFLAFGVNISFNLRKIDVPQLLKENLHSISGDDDLIMQSAARQGLKTVFSTDMQNAPYTELPTSFGNFLRQRKRHLSAAVNYDLKAKIFYALFLLTWTMMLVLLPFSMKFIPFFLLKTVFDIALISFWYPEKTAAFYWGVVLVELLYIPYFWLTGILSRLQTITWK